MALVLLGVGCGGPAQPVQGPVTVTLLTDTSWRMPDSLLDGFERQSGITLVVREVGSDADALADHVARGAGERLGDVVFGLDAAGAPTTLGMFEPYTSPEANKGPQRYAIDKRQRVSAVDAVDVCAVADTEWFADSDLGVPQTFADLTDPRYRNLLVVPDAARTAEGAAFLLGTVAVFGDGWRTYWLKLKANGVRVAASWQEAYEQEFTGSGGAGARPIVVGSPLAPTAAAEEPSAIVLPDTCYERVRYAGVLTGAHRPTHARKVLDFLLSQQFQEELPGHMGTYPVRERVPLPAGWDKLVPRPPEPHTLPADQVRANRDRWITQWRAVMGR